MALMSAVLDTTMPAAGQRNRLSLQTANKHGVNAVGINFIGTDEYKDNLLDYSFSIGTAGDESLGKVGVGISW